MTREDVTASGDAAKDTVLIQTNGHDTDEQGFLDIMAEAEEQQEKLAPALEDVGRCVVELGEALGEIHGSDEA